MSEPSEPQTIAAVALGGVIGASARWAVGTQLAPDAVGSFPWHTFVVNVVGCLAIGLVAARVERPSVAWAFVATGVLGGFTTMSGFAVELNDLADTGESTTLVAYLVATVVVGFGVLLGAEWWSGSAEDDPSGIE